MGLEQFLTAEDKIASLETLRARTFSELYTICLRAGLDPDTVEYETWVLPAENDDNTMSYTLLRAVSRLCETLKIIDSKLA